jgi:hypothetical protein
MTNAKELRNEAGTWTRLAVAIASAKMINPSLAHFHVSPDLFTNDMRARWHAHQMGRDPTILTTARQLRSAVVMRCLLFAIECREEAKAQKGDAATLTETRVRLDRLWAYRTQRSSRLKSLRQRISKLEQMLKGETSHV